MAEKPPSKDEQDRNRDNMSTETDATVLDVGNIAQELQGGNMDTFAETVVSKLQEGMQLIQRQLRQELRREVSQEIEELGRQLLTQKPSIDLAGTGPHLRNEVQVVPDLTFVSRICVIPNGDIFVVNDVGNKQHVIRLDAMGLQKPDSLIYECTLTNERGSCGPVKGIITPELPDGQDTCIYILQKKGKITRFIMSSDDTRMERMSNQVSDVGAIGHGVVLADGVLVLSDYERGNIFRIEFSSERRLEERIRDVKVNGLLQPTTVTSHVDGAKRSYFVCEHGRKQIKIYREKEDLSWDLQTDIGRFWTSPTQPFDPRWAIRLSSGTILVADSSNHRVSEYEYTENSGKLKRHWLTPDDGIEWPTCMSLYAPGPGQDLYLWVVCGMWDEPYRVTRYRFEAD